MDWTRLVFDLIDTRSFSNIWFWIVLAVMWSGAAHWILGVPYDLVQRAQRTGGQAEADLEALVAINARRIDTIAEVSGTWIVALLSALLTALALLGFVYRVEFAQAVFLLGFPMSLVGALSLAEARRLLREAPTGPELWRRLRWHRFKVQLVGMISVFVTSMWGMYQVIVVGPWGQ